MNRSSAIVFTLIAVLLSAAVCVGLIVTESAWRPVSVHPSMETPATESQQLVSGNPARTVNGFIESIPASQDYFILATQIAGTSTTAYQKIYFTPTTTVSVLNVETEILDEHPVSTFSSMDMNAIKPDALHQGDHIQVQMINDSAQHRFQAVSIVLFKISNSNSTR